MASKRRLLVICLLAIATMTNAQISANNGTEWRDSSLIPASRMAQHNEFLNNQYLFPAKPRSQWEVGFKLGTPTIHGDVAALFPNFGYGFHVRKALGYLISLRGEFNHGTPKGLDWKGSYNYMSNPAWASNGYQGHKRTYATYTQGTDKVFYNYKTNLNDISLQALFNLNNIRFHKADPKFSLYAIIGLGVTFYDVKVDALNASGQKYNFNSIASNNSLDSKSTVRNAVKALLDGTYETKGDSDGSAGKKFLGKNSARSTIFGIGGAFKLSKRVNLAFEERLSLVNSDLLDGQRWAAAPLGDAVLTASNDSHSFLSIGLNFNIF